MKTTVLVIIMILFVITSCSTYTCPTYAKKPKKDAGEEV